MAAWPSLTELKQVLGVTSDAQDLLLGAALDAAVEQVKIDVRGTVTAFNEDGDWGDGSEPSPALSRAALILAVMTAKAPDAPYGVAAVFDTGGLRVAAEHPTYQLLLAGHRKAWALR